MNYEPTQECDDCDRPLERVRYELVTDTRYAGRKVCELCEAIEVAEARDECNHADSEITEIGTLFCSSCEREFSLTNGAILYDAIADE